MHWYYYNYSCFWTTVDGGENEWKCVCLHSCSLFRVGSVYRKERACFWLLVLFILVCGLLRYFALSSQRLGSLRTSSRASSPTSPPSTASMTSSCCLISKRASLKNGEKLKLGWSDSVAARTWGCEVTGSGPAGRCRRCCEAACVRVSRKSNCYVLVFMPTSAAFHR